MENARQTVNVALAAIVARDLPGFMVGTGDEGDPRVVPPCVTIEWIDGEGDSPLLPEYRVSLCQIEVTTPNQDTSGADRACEALLEAFGLRIGTRPIGTLLLQAWELDANDEPLGTPLGSNILLRKQSGKGWRRLDPPQQRLRRHILTLEVHYAP